MKAPAAKVVRAAARLDAETVERAFAGGDGFWSSAMTSAPLASDSDGCQQLDAEGREPRVQAWRLGAAQRHRTAAAAAGLQPQHAPGFRHLQAASGGHSDGKRVSAAVARFTPATDAQFAAGILADH